MQKEINIFHEFGFSTFPILKINDPLYKNKKLGYKTKVSDQTTDFNVDKVFEKPGLNLGKQLCNFFVFTQHLGIQEASGMAEMISMQIPVSEMQKNPVNEK